MDTEYAALVENNTWEEALIQPGMKIIPGYWMLVRKLDCFKARWVIQGNHQVKGVDDNEVYANKAKSDSIRLLLALAAT